MVASQQTNSGRVRDQPGWMDLIDKFQELLEIFLELNVSLQFMGILEIG